MSSKEEEESLYDFINKMKGLSLNETSLTSPLLIPDTQKKKEIPPTIIRRWRLTPEQLEKLEEDEKARKKELSEAYLTYGFYDADEYEENEKETTTIVGSKEWKKEKEKETEEKRNQLGRSSLQKQTEDNNQPPSKQTPFFKYHPNLAPPQAVLDQLEEEKKNAPAEGDFVIGGNQSITLTFHSIQHFTPSLISCFTLQNYFLLFNQPKCGHPLVMHDYQIAHKRKQTTYRGR